MTRGILCAISEPSNRAASQEAFDYECREAHKSRREFLQGGNIDILSHEHYARKQERDQVGPCMDVYELSDIEPMISGRVLLEEGGDGPLVTHTYTYKLISAHGNTPGHSSETPEDLVMSSYDPPMTHLDEMNRWLEEEQIPLLKKSPGWLSTLRGSMVLSSQQADQAIPKYVVLHRFRSDSSQASLQPTSTAWAKSLEETIKSQGNIDESKWVYQAT